MPFYFQLKFEQFANSVKLCEKFFECKSPTLCSMLENVTQLWKNPQCVSTYTDNKIKNFELKKSMPCQ